MYRVLQKKTSLIFFTSFLFLFFFCTKFAFADPSDSNNSEQLYPDYLLSDDLYGWVSEYFDTLPWTDENNKLEENFLPAIMQFMIGGIGGIAMIVLFYSGVLMITSFGDSEKREKAKKMLYWSILGIVFMLLAYAIVKGITSLEFNQ